MNVCAFLALMETHRVDVWLDGGWAVDAALGRQTRGHSDVDIVIEERDVPAAVSTLQDVGYAPVPRPDTRAWNFVMGTTLATRSTSTLSSSMSTGNSAPRIGCRLCASPSDDRSFPRSAAALVAADTAGGKTPRVTRPLTEWSGFRSPRF